MVHTIRLKRTARRKLSAIDGQFASLLSRLNTANRAKRGIEIVGDVRESGWEAHWSYVGLMTVDGAEMGEWESIARLVDKAYQTPPYGSWESAEFDEKPYAPGNAAAESDTDYVNVGINDDEWEQSFAHLYGLDAHIKRVRLALDAAIASNWRHRFHCALIGPPGCGKSDICRSIKEALGEDAVLEFDATSTTTAGAQKELTERDQKPRVLLVEEIEKAAENSLSWLLSVLDIRANIKRITARGGYSASTHMLTVATVNDEALFRRLLAGALSSRFTNSVYFSRPSVETLQKILAREITVVGGDLSWIDPTIQYATENEITDPREVTSICLCGGDLLLTGEYQQMLSDTRRRGGYVS